MTLSFIQEWVLFQNGPISFHVVRDGPLENLWGGGEGAGEVQKNIFAQGKIK